MAYRSRRARRGKNSPVGRCMNDSYTPDRRSRAARTPRGRSGVALAGRGLPRNCPFRARRGVSGEGDRRCEPEGDTCGAEGQPRLDRRGRLAGEPRACLVHRPDARPSLDVALRELRAAADRGLVPDDYGVGVLEHELGALADSGADPERLARADRAVTANVLRFLVRSSLRTRASAGSPTPLSRPGEGRAVRDGTARGGRPRSPRRDDRCGRARFPALRAAEAPAGRLPAARGPAGNRAAAAGVAARQDRRRGHLCRRAGLAGAARAAAGPGRGCGRPGRRPVYRPAGGGGSAFPGAARLDAGRRSGPDTSPIERADGHTRRPDRAGARADAVAARFSARPLDRRQHSVVPPAGVCRRPRPPIDRR